MAYASLPDLIERAGEDEILQVADRNDDGIADPDVIEAALIHADNSINGYLAVRYAIPLTAVPPLVVTWAVAIARYHLHRDSQPDNVVRDYKDAISSLKDVGRGAIALPDITGLEPVTSGSNSVGIVGPDPVFSRDNLEGWL